MELSTGGAILYFSKLGKSECAYTYSLYSLIS